MYPIRTPKPYDPTKLATLFMTYTTVYLGNYVSGDYDENSGSHPGVDIVPMSPNDPIHAVLNGTIFAAGTNAADGNFVVIQHDNVLDPATGKKATYYSNYLHLSELSVTKGQTVKEGDIIGKTGNTGQSTGEHLHFQIDVADAPFHPYWPFSFKDAQTLGLGFMEAVNRGLGIENGVRYTVNPLVFLDRVGGSPTPSVPTPVVTPIATPVVTPPKPTVEVASTVTITTPVTSGDDDVLFSDVSPSYLYAPAVAFIKSHGIASGQNGRFFPNANVSRGEILKMAFNASKKSLTNDTTTYFSDVPVGNAFLSYVNTAHALGTVGGYPDGTFRPNAPVTRVEGLKIVLGLLGVQPGTPATSPFPDVKTTDWFFPHIVWANDNDALESGASFNPNAPLTRGEVASLIYRAMNG